MEINLDKVNKIYFIGVGGIGISAVAGISHIKSFLVEGSDATENEIVSDLRNQGIGVYVPHDQSHIDSSIGLVVSSVAVPDNNSEIIKAKELKIPILTYPQFLGLLLKNKFGIGVSGTDGKTTTTAMLAKVLIESTFDPTVVLGSKADFLEDNWRVGESQYFVFESDEYRRAFDNYNPRIAIITNIGVDHLDYYQDEVEYLSAFKNYLNKLSSDDFIIINNDDKRSVEAGIKSRAKKITYSLKSDSDFQATDIVISKGEQKFKVSGIDYRIKFPGDYNIYNAMAVIATAKTLKIADDIIVKSLENFSGLWRRFEKLGYYKQAEIIADYAHTPDAVNKVIKAVKDFYSDQRVLIVFQPHQYGRTKNLFNQFIQSFNQAEKVLLPDIFYVKGRENPEDFDVSSEKLVEEIKKLGIDIEASGNLLDTEKRIKELVDEFDKILILGAGDVYGVAKNLVK